MLTLKAGFDMHGQKSLACKATLMQICGSLPKDPVLLSAPLHHDGCSMVNCDVRVDPSIVLLVCRGRELNRLQQVVYHPAFQANPLASIMNHLQATLPSPKPHQAVRPVKKKKSGN